MGQLADAIIKGTNLTLNDLQKYVDSDGNKIAAAICCGKKPEAFLPFKKRLMYKFRRLKARVYGKAVAQKG